MAVAVRVARVDELPPGRGRVIEVGAHEVAVYNLEGKLHAQTVRPAPVRPGECAPACPPGGRWFDALAADSPARLRGPVGAYHIEIIEEYVVVMIEEG
jgi:hypothetical protein